MAKRRGKNDGTIRQRSNGRWEARVTIGYHSDGRQKQKSYYGATQAEVLAKMKEAQLHLNKGTFIEPSDMTVQHWLEAWCRDYGALRWRPKTANVHSDNIRLHLIPALGIVKLSKLRTDHVQSSVVDQQGKGYSPGSIRKQLEPLSGAIKQAVQNGLLAKNVMDGVKPPKMESREVVHIPVEEQAKLLEVLPDTTSGRALRFILSSGLRASELCGLRWSDIEEESFTIRQGAQYVKQDGKRQLVVAPPKTAKGRRTIPLTPAMRELLQQQRKAQLQDRLAAGLAWEAGTPGEGNTPVFATEVGTVLDRANLGRALRTYLTKAGLPSRGLHALRHTFATNWVRSRADLRSLSEILGHTNVAFTMQQYVHSDMPTKLAGMLAAETSQAQASIQ